MTNRELAEKIVTVLFTDRFEGKADRLELKYKQGLTERAGGGWGFEPAVNRVEKILERMVYKAKAGGGGKGSRL